MGRSRGHQRRALVASVMAMPVLLGTASGAWAAEDDPVTVDNLPSLTDHEVEQFIEPIEVPDIEPIDVPDVEPFEPEVSSSGGDTVVSLDTDVLFGFGEATLGQEAKDAVIDAVTDVPDGAEVAVVGHTDSVGSDSDNKKLSKERAQAVADVIEKERDDPDLTVRGEGESDPVEANTKGGKDNAEGRAKNRRVEVRYTE